MQPILANEERFIEVKVRNVEALFSEMRIKRSSIPDGLYVYEVRHKDEDWSEPCEIALGIMVNFYGTLISKQPILKNDDEHYFITEDNEWAFISSLDSTGLEEWIKN